MYIFYVYIALLSVCPCPALFLERVNIFLISNGVDLDWEKTFIYTGSHLSHILDINRRSSRIIEIGCIPEMTNAMHIYIYFFFVEI